MSNPSPRAAAFFDLDKTIIATSSTTAFSGPFMSRGLIGPGAVLRTAYAQLMFQVGRADHDQTERLRAAISGLVTGWDVAEVTKIIAETLHDHIDPYVYAEAVALMHYHQKAGRDVVIVSASGSELVEPIAAALGADHAISTRMETVDGKYTGNIEFYAYGDNKAVAIRQLAETQNYDLSASYAYSDSPTDAPMLDAVGHAYVVNPDRTFRTLAIDRGWGIIKFERPVALQTQYERTSAISVGFLSLVVVGVAAAIFWRRRRRLS